MKTGTGSVRSALSRRVMPVAMFSHPRRCTSQKIPGDLDRASCQYAPIVSRPYQEITYIAWLRAERDCLVVDPGLEPDLILRLFGRAAAHARRDSDHARPLRPHRRQRSDEAPLARVARWSSACMKRKS